MQYFVAFSLLFALACPAAAQRVTVRDATGQAVALPAPARRVASLVGSAIDIMAWLGVADRVVARTRYDTARVVARAANLGGGIDPSIELLVASRPDLFLAWKFQATTSAVRRMRDLGVPVYLVETKDTAALYSTVRDLGTLLGLAPRALSAADSLRQSLRATQRAASSLRRARRPTAVFVVSRSPVIIAARGSYMAELVSVAGADNPFADVRGEFPTLSLEAFVARDPDIVLMGQTADGTRQLDALRSSPGWRDLRAVRNGAVIEVNGDQWSRPGFAMAALVRSLATELQRVSAQSTPPR